ncbi:MULTISPECIES: phosphoglycolate phosphatase [unclassified Mesorhizobium]|uniref:phosphoglycolate phosphatase n=1 Tax=unclassified Mesorhizobium TaxID=325217 RepID=UPI00112AD90F|nr:MULTISPECIES: phosphoglycolate phosphatase [unclassified Mesorhizobium]MBZ9983500.1 phosphoglycolate phosphatase [Mesorhizobium sp. BR-1-1-8]TPI52141.1 phosphoglycolate phosphatase [Mesorhizobium sp. B3-1-1]TPJ83411.1 phosphoglycolate phosphatase [Mesorhizobium sp. B2-6-3]TPJ97471.1 phosphoglycolate phosphatase [Mesorhizobium sp. B2-5-10]TPK07220.1 phosphoglycolate phosphatase [Mesorhizobium sp. B2-5-11]
MNVGAGRSLRPPKAILFDLDGTLVDSAPDITAAVNELLASRDLPPLRLDQVKAMIGGGVRKLVERAFAASGAPLVGNALDEANRVMAPIYSRHLTGLTRLMPGVREVLTHFYAKGMAMGVATNKPQLATREILLHFGLTEYFRAIIGGDAVTCLKPAPDALLLALAQLGVDPCDALLVGDSGADAGAARAAGMPVILLRGGYTHFPVEELGADQVCDSLFDLPAAMQGLQAGA